MKSLFFLSLSLLVLCACEKDLSIEQADYSPKIVVDGWIESGHYARIALSLSSPFLTDYDSASIRATFLNYAKITVSDSKGNSEILTLFQDNTYFPPYIYRTTSLKGVEGETYHLKIEVSGHILTSTTSIPTAPIVKNCYFSPKTYLSGIIKAEIETPTNQTAYIFIQERSVKADKNFHPASPSVFSRDYSQSSKSSDIYRVRENNFYYVNPNDDYYNKWPKWQFSLFDTVLIKIGTIDKNSFTVLKSIFEDRNNRENPFTLNGNEIISNINGGIGRWTGIGMADIKVVYSH